MDLSTRHLQVVVPPIRPSDVAFAPHYVVRIDDFTVHVQIENWINCLLLALRSQLRFIFWIRLCRLRDAVRLHFETNDAIAIVFVWAFMILEVELHMVVHVIPVASHNANWKTIHVCELATASDSPPHVSCSRRQIIDYPVDQVLVVDHTSEEVFVLLRQRHVAENFARLIA